MSPNHRDRSRGSVIVRLHPFVLGAAGTGHRPARTALGAERGDLIRALLSRLPPRHPLSRRRPSPNDVGATTTPLPLPAAQPAAARPEARSVTQVGQKGTAGR